MAMTATRYGSKEPPDIKVGGQADVHKLTGRTYAPTTAHVHRACCGNEYWHYHTGGRKDHTHPHVEQGFCNHTGDDTA